MNSAETPQEPLQGRSIRTCGCSRRDGKQGKNLRWEKPGGAGARRAAAETARTGGCALGGLILRGRRRALQGGPVCGKERAVMSVSGFGMPLTAGATCLWQRRRPAEKGLAGPEVKSFVSIPQGRVKPKLTVRGDVPLYVVFPQHRPRHGNPSHLGSGVCGSGDCERNLSFTRISAGVTSMQAQGQGKGC